MRKKTIFTLPIFALVIASLFSQTLTAQERYTVRSDPKNNKRKIIDLQPVVRKAELKVDRRNALDVSRGFPRKAIVFKPFEMKNPRSGKALNPDAVLTIKLPDGTQRKTTVKQYYEQLNKLEEALAAKGRTLREPTTFNDLRPKFTNNNTYSVQPKLSSGYKTTNFKVNPPKKTNTGFINIGNVVLTPTVNPVVLGLVNWDAKLYVSLFYPNHGTSEFPTEWATVSGTSFGRKVYPIIMQVPKGMEGIIKRVDWQVSDQPFDGTIKEVNVPNVKLSGTINPLQWASGIRGAEIIPDYKTSKFAYDYIDLSKIEPEPVQAVKAYYIRTIAYNQAGEVLKVSSTATANYGAINKPFKIASPESNTVPGFNYQFPDANSGIPFGVFVKGSGFSTYKNKAYTDDTYEILKTTGYKVSASAALGIKYFNFLSIVSDQEPASKDLTIIKANFIAALGSVPSYGSSDQGIKLTLSMLDGIIPPYEIGFSTPVPNVPNAISLDYDVVQPIDMGLIDSRFFIGPVPIRITAGITGEAGLKLFGQVNTSTFEGSGGIKPFLNTRFYASGGVDAIIAYATLNADVNPLLSLDMPVTFSSSGTPLTFSTNLSGLAGRVYLKVGFYYPCPSLEKIVGWLTGDEDLPLCECNWEYNIFDFPGFTHTMNY